MTKKTKDKNKEKTKVESSLKNEENIKKEKPKSKKIVCVNREGAGRPRKNLDEEQIHKLALLHCTVPEMADFFNVHPDTLRNNYYDIINKAKAEGKIRLRKKQFAVAEKGNVCMLIWLGKQLLKQSERIINENHNENTDRIDLSGKSIEQLTAALKALEE